MGFLNDPDNLHRAIDPETGWELTRFTRDVPANEKRYYFDIPGVVFPFRVICTPVFCDNDKIVNIIGDTRQLEESYHRRRRTAAWIDDEQRFFRDTVLPAVREAILCLERRRYVTRSFWAQGWRVIANFIEPEDASQQQRSPDT